MDSPPPFVLKEKDMHDLVHAKTLLENPGLTARLAGIVGQPLEKGIAMLPGDWTKTVQNAVQKALVKALEVAVATISKDKSSRAGEMLHKIMVGASGGVGGAFGLAAVVIELPISTTIMLRSIAEIARDEGHDLSDIKTRLACLEVFALGSRTEADDAAESLYWVVRAAIAKSMSDAAAYIAEKGIVETSAPAVVRLVSNIASRFGVIVSEQIAAKAVPILGAAAGSMINVLFMDHFQDMARGHFIVRRLENAYGSELIRQVYDTIVVPVKQ